MPISDPRSAWFASEFDRHIAEVSELVAIPSIASDPAHAEDLQQAARWLADKLAAVGLDEVTVHPAEGYPVVTAEWHHAEGQPTVLLYGHFDVQPAIAELWDSPPFEPIVRDGNLLGRGAIDCKGALMMAVTAVEAMLALDGTLPVNLKFVFEGQEEFGSPTLMKWVGEHAEWLGVDYAYSTDAMMQSDDQGLIWRGLKGAVLVSFTVSGANRPVHSGIYGGTVPNAAVGLAQIISSFHHPDGSVAVAGFYDHVDEITESEKAEIAALPFDGDAVADDFGIDALVGEDGYSVQEIRFLRPTLEVTGVDAGIHGTGATVPNEARGWILCRLVTSQVASEIGELVEQHILDHVPPGLQAEVAVRPLTPGIKYSDDEPSFQIARSVLADVFGREPLIGYVGGGVPILAYMRLVAGRDLVTFGFQREDENFHAPNEYMRLSDFTLGQDAYTRLLEAHRDLPLRPPEPTIGLTATGEFVMYEPETGAGGHQGY